MNDDMLTAITQAALDHQLPSTLLLAIVLTESGGKLNALRAEPGFRYLWDCKNNRAFRPLERFELERTGHPAGFTAMGRMSADTEWWGQRMSWGPMQIMGATARQLGFSGPFPALCGAMGVDYGALYLATMKKRYYGDNYGWENVIAAYNAGSPRRDDNGILENAGYVAKVRKNGFTEY